MLFVRTPVLVATAAITLTLAGCGDSKKPPEGQVVATVDGKEITIHDLRAEIDQLPNGGGDAPRKLVESVALANIVDRRMLAAEATKRALDKTPEFLIAKARAEELLLVQILQADIQKQVKPTSRETAQKFVAENPVMYGDRKIFTLDQIQFLRPANIDQLPLKDAKTMAEVERVLIEANIDYRRTPVQFDTLTVEPGLSADVIRLSSNPEPIMYVDRPSGAAVPIVAISNITATRTEPFIGERAISHAQALLTSRQIQTALETSLKDWKASYKDKIVYAKGYGPVVLPPPKAAPAKAAAAATTPIPAPAAAPAG